MKPAWKVVIVSAFVLAGGAGLSGVSRPSDTVRATTPVQAKMPHIGKAASTAEIATAVRAAAQKDCGCGACAAKGCDPCHGKNCYFCAAKALVTKECGCGMCDAKGCTVCGPGCDVCKFHLAPVEEAKKQVKSKS